MGKSNTLLIVIDALRADHVTYAGDELDSLTPNLLSLAQECVVFKNCLAQGISTAPSMTSLLTSTYPLDYGGHWYLVDSRKTIAEMLRENGYDTAAIHSNPNVSRIRNFHKGFDKFDESLLPGYFGWLLDRLPARFLQLGNKFFRMLQRQPYLPAHDLNQKILRWIEQASSPFFVWTQYMDVHGPYLSHRGNPYLDKLRAEILYQKAMKNPGGITPKEKETLRESYKAEVRYVDQQLGALVNELKRSGMWDEMLVIVTADHGDEFGEHGLFGHKNNPHEELVKVPLLIKFPISFNSKPGTFVEQPVRLLDLLPTILDVNGLVPEESIQRQIEGQSLVPLAQTEGATTKFLNYVIIEKEVKGSDKLRIGIRTEEWKFIFDGENQVQELYHLAKDPNEQHNVFWDYPRMADEFEEILHERLSQIAERSANVRVPNVVESKEVEDRLRALGYIE